MSDAVLPQCTQRDTDTAFLSKDHPTFDCRELMLGLEQFPLWRVRCHAGISRQRNIRYPGMDRGLGTGSRADALGRHDNEAMVP